MPDRKCSNEDEYLFPVLHQVNGCKGCNEQLVIEGIPADNVCQPKLQ
jgi:hypothetical protein